MDKLLEIFYVAARRRILSRLFPVDTVIINNFTNIFIRVIWNSYTGNFGKLPFFLKVTCLYSRELPPPIKQNLRNVFWESSEIVRNFPGKCLQWSYIKTLQLLSRIDTDLKKITLHIFHSSSEKLQFWNLGKNSAITPWVKLQQFNQSNLPPIIILKNERICWGITF